MIDTEALRKKVIDLAIQGKLTEQLPSGGDAENLYAQILEEKTKLIREGVIKKDTSLPDIMEEEIPFEIPKNWKWVRLGDITYNHGQMTPQNRFCYIDVGTLDNVNHKLNENENIIEAKDAPSRAKKIVENGDVLYSTVRPYLHNICIVDREFSYRPIASTAFAVMHTYDGCLLNGYLYYWLLSGWFDKYANGDNSKGTLYPAIGEKDFFKGLIPLAPIEEQKRIVELIDESVSITRSLDVLQQRYSSDLSVLKSKILDAGIQGKLTEQFPEDGTAEALYAKIQDEKQKLIEEGKIKKDKPLADITEDEIPFDIPESWKWCRIGSLFTLQAGKNITASDIYDNPDENNRFLCYGGNGIRGYVHEANRHGYYAIIGRQGALCGCINFAEGDFYATEHAVVVDHYNLTDTKWGGLFLKALNLNQYATATAQPGLSVANINQVLIPLPPLEEQKRIVAKIEEILPYCDGLLDRG